MDPGSDARRRRDAPRLDLDCRSMQAVEVDGLLVGADLGLTRWFCCENHRGRSAEKVQPCHVVVFVHGGAFCQEGPRGRGLADATRATFFNEGEPFQTSHPCGTGDHGSGIAMSEPRWRALLREVVPAWSDRPGETLFPAPFAPIPPALLRRQAQLIARLERQAVRALGRLALEETIADIATLALTALAGAPNEPALVAGPSPGARARERVEAVQRLLAADPTAPWSLADLAQGVGISVFRLCREFRALTGCPVHQYLLRLRLARALHHLADDPTLDLTTLALDLGFDSHSHFTAALRHHCGITPSAFRASFAVVPSAC